MTTTRVAINGFGRIGRGVLRAALEGGADLDIVAVNDIAAPQTLAHLLAYDSIYGRFPVQVRYDNGHLYVGEQHTIRLCAERDPRALPWKELEVDVVLESTGRFRSRDEAGLHLHAGARKVILSAPAKGKEPVDANPRARRELRRGLRPRAPITSLTNASCTTNCLAPVAKVLHETVGIRHGLMTTVHAYTADQNLQDMPHKRPAARACRGGQPDPDLDRCREGAGPRDPRARRPPARLRGASARCPPDRLSTSRSRPSAPPRWRRSTPRSRRTPTPARSPGSWPTTRTRSCPATSSSRPTRRSSTRRWTSVIDGTLVKVVAWYDNEWGYSNRLVEMAERVLAPVALSVR